VCLCAYTSHGHCGVLRGSHVDSVPTLAALAKMAVSHAAAGADYVAPSAMREKQVLTIREALDKYGYRDTKIMAYSAKFSSQFYGPFREAANSSPLFGGRSTYQLGFESGKGAHERLEEDIIEGADIIMVKPALCYLDIIREAKYRYRRPLAAYNVSGEYAMVKSGVKSGYWDEKKIVFEIITAIKRAGADIIITYHAREIAQWLKKEKDEEWQKINTKTGPYLKRQNVSL